jgi:acyl-CoA dehydrogenase
MGVAVMDASELLDPFVRLLDDCAAPATVRAIDNGGDAAPLWQAIAASGYLDALIPDGQGGVGLDLATLAPLIEALGAHALPLPVADTMVARALIGADAPPGPIVLAPSLAQPVAGARLAEHALVDTGSALVLCPIAALDPAPSGVHGSSALLLRGTPQGPVLARPAAGLRAIAAVLRALLIAGAAEAVTVMATNHANTRVQFGKPIGRQQAVQHLLAVMAQDMIAARIAARLGASGGLNVPLALAASAKITTSEAAARLAASAHAVHGAIGIAAEYDLNLLTRRLHEWRLADGSDGYWAGVLGSARLAGPQSSVDWVREAIFG